MTTTAVSTLAQGALLGAFTRAVPVGDTGPKKGHRVIVEMRGEREGDEREWFTLCGLLALVRMLRTECVTTL